MRRICCVVLLIFFSIGAQSQSQRSTPDFKKIYREAEQLFYLSDPTKTDDSIAITKYLSVIRLHVGQPDSILRDANYKVAIYLQTNENFGGAIPYLLETIRLFPVVGNLSDSLQYLPWLYLGNSYYANDLLDSAFDAYKKAEAIALKYQRISGLERLYNTLGVTYFESGNYQQSAVYFDKAISTLKENPSGNESLFVNYSNNYASALRKTGEWQKAIAIYKSLLRYEYNREELLNNIGSTYLENDRDSLALVYLNQIKTGHPEKLNELAIANMHLGRFERAKALVSRAIGVGDNPEHRKNIKLGMSFKLLGDILTHEEKIDAALTQYQKALQQLIFSFNEADYKKNPVDFRGQYYVSELFETLVAKAHAFALNYKLTSDQANLEHCIDTYRSIYEFTDYLSHTYDRDDARLALGDRKHISHDEPIEACMTLFQQTKDRKYLSQAFVFDEKNKASVLSMQMQQNSVRSNMHLPANLLNRESSLKKRLTSHLLKLHSTSEGEESVELQNKIRDTYIDLSRIQGELDKYEKYRSLRFLDNTIPLADFQKIIPANYLVISFHFGEQQLIRFAFTKDLVKMESIPISGSLSTDIKKLRLELAATDVNSQEFIQAIAKNLHSILLGGLDDLLNRHNQLMIIPDDELSLLPFEILQDKSGNLLLDKHTLTYNYSCTLIKGVTENKLSRQYQSLAFAPFFEKSLGEFKSLSSSKDEIAELPGKEFIGSSATKAELLKWANGYDVLHLATHAVLNDNNDVQSYIAFYPRGTDSSDKLYESEIFNLNLTKPRLAILSACETGSGLLVKGEGVMSLGRAFSYAGCPNTITSLWLADDRSTAYICKAIHQNLKKGYSIAEALQNGIKSYRNDDKVAVRLKGPPYWTHLRLIGGFGKTETMFVTKWYWLGGIFLLFAGILIYVSRQRKRSSKQTMN